MKKHLTKIFLFSFLVFTLNSCTKYSIPNSVYGYYTSAVINTPFGSSIQLFEDNVAEIRINGTYLQESFTYDANTIYFINGNIAHIHSINEIVFEQQVEYLNPEYYDGNNDGYDDWDPSKPHYIWESHYYSYYKQ